MRLPNAGVRGRRAAEPSKPEPEEDTEPVHHEHPHTELHEHPHSEHHPSHHDYNNMKEKFMNELDHLHSKIFRTPSVLFFVLFRYVSQVKVGF